MRREEADLITGWIKKLGLRSGDTCLNIGSSTREFREVSQPHIHSRFVKPLEACGIRFVHCDMKQAEGVDEIGDILDPEFRSKLRRYGARLLVCSNLLEHLTDPKAFAEACGDLVVDGGYGVFSVPASYPYHPDPIDTMLRPNPAELAALLPEWQPVRMYDLKLGTYWHDLKKQGRPLARLARHATRVALPFYRSRYWRPNASRLLWLFRPYRLSLVLLKKQEGGPSASKRSKAM